MTDSEKFISTLKSNPLDVESLLSLFDGFETPISLFDDKGNLLNINDAALDLYGIIDKNRFMAAGINYYDDPNFKEAVDPRILASRDIVISIVYDYDKAEDKFKGLMCKSGRIHLSLRLHPVYDKQKKLKFVLVFSKNQTEEKEKRSNLQKLLRNMPYMMNQMGFSTWVYDIASGKRILGAGSHLFPKQETLDEFKQCIFPQDLRIFENMVFLIINTNKKETSSIIRFIDKDRSGEVIFLEIFCTPQLKDDKVSGVYFLTKDVTDREKKQYELLVKERLYAIKEQEASYSSLLFHTLMDRISALFFVKDVDNGFKYTIVNDLFCQKAGKSRSDIIGHTDMEIIQDKESADIYFDMDMNTISKGTINLREETFWGGEKKVWQTIKNCITSPNGHRMIVGLSQDITQLDKAYSDLKAAKDEAEKSDKLKTSFLANISHEIRTPLNSIMGFSSLLVTIDDPNEKEQYEKVIIDNGNALTELINDILDLSQIEAGYTSSKKEDSNISELIREYEFQFNGKMKKGVEFHTSVPYENCIVKIDRTHLDKVIQKIIKNSIIYTDAGSITVGYEIADGGINVFIEDTGRGMTEEELFKLFQRFEKLDENAPGLGLELSICKLMTEMMSGTIQASSVKGKGTKVWVWLPTQTAIS